MHKCPRDRSPLTARYSADLSSLLCHKCNGTWLPTKVVALALVRVPSGSAPTHCRQTHPTALRCPDDDTLLVMIDYEGVEIDLCTKCNGVWLDHGEIDQIIGRKTAYTASHAAMDVLGGIPPDAVAALGEGAMDITGVIVEFLASALSGL